MSLNVNNIEIIDLDADEAEPISSQNTTGKYVNSQQVLHTHSPQKTNEFLIVNNSGDLLQDKNIGSTTDTANSPKINVSKCLDSKTGKTLALIPFDCLKYCDMKDGKFRVKLNTLNKLQGKNAVYLCNVPEGNDLKKNLNSTQKVENTPEKYHDVPKLVKIGSPKVSNLIPLDKGLGKRPEVLIAPKLQCSLNPQVGSNFFQNPPLSLPSTKSPVGSLKHATPVKKRVTPVKKRKTPKKVRSLLSPPLMPTVQTLLPYSIQPPTANYKAKIKSIIHPKNSLIGDIVNTSIDLTEEQDSLTVASDNQSLKKSSDCNTDPLSFVPLIHEENSKHSLQEETLSDNLFELGNEKVYVISRNISNVYNNAESAKKMSKLTDFHNSNDVLECDPLGDLPNIFEPIVTLNESNVTQNTLENTLTEGLRGSGIPNEKMQELEIMIQNNHITSPFKVMIPSKYLKYCTKKNGKYLVDLNALKKINREKQETTAESNNDGLILDNELKNSCNESDKLDQKGKNCHLSGQKSNCPGPKSIIHNTIVPEQCRYLYMKSSAWDKVDPESTLCKGFNEREINISNLCFEKFSMYLDNSKKDNQKLRTDLFTSKTIEETVTSGNNNQIYVKNSFFDFCCNELYFTKKIDILDKIGRRVRTEHVAYNKRLAPDDRDEYKKRKLENSTECMLAKMKLCSVVIERNQIVEGRIKWRLAQQKIRKRLNSKFIKTLTSLNRDISRPTIILNKYNIHIIRLDEKFCTRCNVIFVKNYEDDFPESIYKNTLFINLVEKKLVKLTSPSILQDYFTLKNLPQKF